MIIFQTAGGGDGFTFDSSGVIPNHTLKIEATTFNNNNYIHRLNRTLQAEMRTIAAYRCLRVRALDHEAQDQAIIDHQNAAKALIHLIIVNRGIPEDSSLLTVNLTRALVQLCSSIPAKIFDRAAITTTYKLEKTLVANYNRLIQQAPGRDLILLNQLLQKAEQHMNNLPITD